MRTVAGRSSLVVLVVLLTLPGPAWSGSKASQAPRVVQARASHDAAVRQLFAEHGVPFPPPRIFLRAFKDADSLELWAGPRRGALTLVRTYPICARSGGLGPKRRRGDLQVPEGAYWIDRFNAYSTFHLSLGLNYPNDSDRVLGYRRNLGGDIFIHGDCVTIGCLPIENERIEELFLIALAARDNGQKRIPVHIFPTRLDDAGLHQLQSQPGAAEHLDFWSNLRLVYEAFESTHQVPKVWVQPATGQYRARAVGQPRSAEAR